MSILLENHLPNWIRPLKFVECEHFWRRTYGQLSDYPPHVGFGEVQLISHSPQEEREGLDGLPSILLELDQLCNNIPDHSPFPYASLEHLPTDESSPEPLSPADSRSLGSTGSTPSPGNMRKRKTNCSLVSINSTDSLRYFVMLKGVFGN